MKYVIDSLEDKSKDVIYYIEAGDAMKAMIFNPDVSVLMNHMDKRYNVIKCIWGGQTWKKPNAIPRLLRYRWFVDNARHTVSSDSIYSERDCIWKKER